MSTQFPNSLIMPEIINHRGKLVAFGYASGTADDTRIFYRVLDLKVTSTRDENDWQSYDLLAFTGAGYGGPVVEGIEPPQLRFAGMSLLGLPTVFRDEKGAETLTAIKPAKKPFHAVSDGQYVYLFRPSDQGTLMVNRYVMVQTTMGSSDAEEGDGDSRWTLQPAWETRFKYSENKCIPQSENDIPDFRDPENLAFIEPTLVLPGVFQNDGDFDVTLVPAVAPHPQRWLFAALRKLRDEAATLELYSIPRTEDGLFDVTDLASGHVTLALKKGTSAVTFQHGPAIVQYAQQEAFTKLDPHKKPEKLSLKKAARVMLAVPVTYDSGTQAMAVVDFALGPDGMLEPPSSNWSLALSVIDSVKGAEFYSPTSYSAGTEGRSTCGYLLGELKAMAAPYLLEGNDGLVHLYYSEKPDGGGSNGSFKVAQFNTGAQGATLALQLADGKSVLALQSHLADAVLNGSSVTVKNTAPVSAAFCDLSVNYSAQSGFHQSVLTPTPDEAWNCLPRAPGLFAAVLNGLASDDLADPKVCNGERVFYDYDGKFSGNRMVWLPGSNAGGIWLLARKSSFVLGDCVVSVSTGRTSKLTIKCGFTGAPVAISIRLIPYPESVQVSPIPMETLAKSLSGDWFDNTYEVSSGRLYGLKGGDAHLLLAPKENLPEHATLVVADASSKPTEQCKITLLDKDAKELASSDNVGRDVIAVAEAIKKFRDTATVDYFAAIDVAEAIANQTWTPITDQPGQYGLSAEGLGILLTARTDLPGGATLVVADASSNPVTACKLTLNDKDKKALASVDNISRSALKVVEGIKLLKDTSNAVYFTTVETPGLVGNQNGGALGAKDILKTLFAAVNQAAQGHLTGSTAGTADTTYSPFAMAVQRHQFHGSADPEHRFFRGFGVGLLSLSGDSTNAMGLSVANTAAAATASGGHAGAWKRAKPNACLGGSVTAGKLVELTASQGAHLNAPTADSATVLQPGHALTAEAWVRPVKSTQGQIITANFGSTAKFGEIVPRYCMGLKGQNALKLSDYKAAGAKKGEEIAADASKERFHGRCLVAGSHPAFHLGHDSRHREQKLPFTLEAWISPESGATSLDDVDYCIVQAISTVRPNMPAYQLSIDKDQYLWFSYTSDSAPHHLVRVRSGKAITSVEDDLKDGWYHVALVYSGYDPAAGGVETVSFYVEGEYLSSADLSGKDGANKDYKNNLDVHYGSPVVYLGAGQNIGTDATSKVTTIGKVATISYVEGKLVASETTGSKSRKCNSVIGKLAQVRLWRDNKTQSEIQNAMYLRLNGSEPALAGSWPLGDFFESSGKFIVPSDKAKDLADANTSPNTANLSLAVSEELFDAGKRSHSHNGQLLGRHTTHSVAITPDAQLLAVYAAAGRADDKGLQPVLGSAFVRSQRWSHIAMSYQAGGALNLNTGSSGKRIDFAHCGNDAVLNPDTAFTLEAWVQLSSHAPGATDVGHSERKAEKDTILSKWGYEKDDRSYELSIDKEHRLCVKACIAPKAATDPKKTPSPKMVWATSKVGHEATLRAPCYVVATVELIRQEKWAKDKSEFTVEPRLNLYLNGQLIEVDQEIGDEKDREDGGVLWDTAYLQASQVEFNIGSSGYEPKRVPALPMEETGHFHGLIASPRFWRRALSAPEIAKAYYKRDVPADATGLAAAWPLQDGSGRTAADVIGAHHAVLSRPTLWAAMEAVGKLRLYVNGDDLRAERITLADFHPDDTLDKSIDDRADLNAQQKADAKAAPRVKKTFGDAPNLSLGAMSIDTKNQCGIAGFIDEVRIWHAARTPEQLSDDMHRPLLGTEVGLVGYWNFDGAVDESWKDKSTQGNHLTAVGSAHTLADAENGSPVGNEAPMIRNAYGGQKNGYQRGVCGRPAAAEYADAQRAADGSLFAVSKRGYANEVDSPPVKDTAFSTGYKLGDLAMTFLGQVQTKPSIVGYIEGLPPVPSENQTRPGWIAPDADEHLGYTRGHQVELTTTDDVKYSYGYESGSGAEWEIAWASGWQFKSGEKYQHLGGGIDMWASKVPAGGKFALVKAPDFRLEASVKGTFNGQVGNRQQGEQGEGTTRIVLDRQTSTGDWEPFQGKQSDYWYPALGRRFLLGNVGYARVKSRVLDLYLLRLLDNGAMVGQLLLPNPDIPEDSNIIMFPINPRYQQQGTLDGKVGLKNHPLYPNADRVRGSYFKPLEAYRLKRAVEEQNALLGKRYSETQTRYGEFAGYGLKDAAKHQAGKTAPAAPGVARDMFACLVWNSNGGLYKERYEYASEYAEAYSANFDWAMGTGVSAAVDWSLGSLAAMATNPVAAAVSAIATGLGGVATGLVTSMVPSAVAGDAVAESAEGVAAISTITGAVSVGATVGTFIALAFGVDVFNSLSVDVMRTARLSYSVSRSRSEGHSFSMDVNVGTESYLKGWIQDPDPEKATGGGTYTVEDCPGKVNAYRFYSFYLHPDLENGAKLFNEVIDPLWLQRSDDPDAAAMRSVMHNPGHMPWRVLHRVTYVSRVPPRFGPGAEVLLPPPERTPAELAGNAALIRALCKSLPRGAGLTAIAAAVRTGLDPESATVEPALANDLPGWKAFRDKARAKAGSAEAIRLTELKRQIIAYVAQAYAADAVGDEGELVA